MIKYLVVVLAVAGGFYAVSRHASLESGLQYVSQNKGAFWAPRASFTIGFIYYQREDYSKAKEVFTQLLTDYPTCQFAARGLFYLEDSAESIRDWDTAKAAADRYIEEHPTGDRIELMRRRQQMLRYQHGP
ncbi:MAG: tetratricopeptide repeat protein [Elusimicrobia bacterium]|nr:tetratricopeptide repeat protein [Elusimicrobiota bacterium]